MLVVNLFGAPGSGKSTIQADVYRRLKQRGINAEIILEWAKMLTWEGRHTVLKHGQPYIFGRTHFDMQMLRDKVDVLIMDSPLVLGACYDGLNGNPTSHHFLPMVVDIHHSFDNMNYMLRRTFAYEGAGRNQDEDNAAKIDRVLRATLDAYGIVYGDLDSDDETGEMIAEAVLRKLRP